jgi:hypothetical protein
VLSGGTLIETLRFVPPCDPLGWFAPRLSDPVGISRSFRLIWASRARVAGSWRSRRTWGRWTGASGTCSGSTRGSCARTMSTATTSSPSMGCSPRYSPRYWILV